MRGRHRTIVRPRPVRRGARYAPWCGVMRRVRPTRRAALRWALTLLAALSADCVSRRTIASPPTGAASSATRARFHLRDGTLILAERWSSDGTVFTLHGARYDAERRPVSRGAERVPRADIALVETTGSGAHGAAAQLTVMGVVTVASIATSVVCLTVPKACFGSCPTFYVPTPEGPMLQAEGFSSSIARSLEAGDLDDLPAARPRDGALTVTMRNEAYETHVLRRVSLVAVDAPAGSAAYRAFDAEVVHAVGETAAPEACDRPEPCPLLAARDGREWTPGSDGVDLASRTTLTLRFAPPRAREVGLVLTARNSLMSTWAMYHFIGLLGRTYGDFLARVERASPLLMWRLWGFSRTLGGVEVSVRRGGRWERVDALPYIGPNARATRVAAVTVEDPDAPLEVRLSFARAHWRIDALRAGPLVRRDLAQTEVDAEVLAAGARDTRDIARRLRGEGERVVNLPGEDVTLRFAVPEVRGAPGYFLRSRGYYYEWTREEWMREEDPDRAEDFLRDPARALREMAAPYRAQEDQMEAVFEASRFDAPRAP